MKIQKQEIKEMLETIKEIETIKEYGSRYMLEITPIQEKESFMIELTFTYPDNSNKKSLPNLWYRAGYTDKVLNDYINITTYFTTKDGDCVGRYNPTIKGHGNINFDKKLEISLENIETLVKDCIELYKNDNK